MSKAATKANSNDDIVQWVTFKLADETYGINVMQVQEVLRVSEIAPVPGAPHYVLGIINLRGNVVTVIDTRIRLGLATAEVTDSTRIVIIETARHGGVIGHANFFQTAAHGCFSIFTHIAFGMIAARRMHMIIGNRMKLHGLIVGLEGVAATYENEQKLPA